MTDIVAEARRRGITRLCHFTRSVNLAHILATREIRATDQLEQSAEGYRPTDDHRLDGHRSHVSCSIEYPNSWYLDRARRRDPNFQDWVVLALDVELLGSPGVKLSQHNASRDRGAGINAGLDAFISLFEAEVLGRERYTRGPAHPDWWPTDDQAEVLVPAPISLSNVHYIVVKDDEQAELELFRLRQRGDARLSAPPLVVAPTLFDKRELSESVRAGRRPREFPFRQSGTR
ncbi:DarT ssDNA thymidine ADP-ribosyltransferase family protein [Saccharopolyspora sp. NPDC050642]|uniref:DarT ssDNA thymidine ADP-ribosyltransferase family protein n=1 Tax=Saccharopolyspora sp. NPDC050642 TaxID=3157099 RepID=UPI003411F06E